MTEIIEGLTEEEFLICYREYIMGLQEFLEKEEQVEMPLQHDFAPGVYIRSIFMPKHTFVMGKTHLTEHFNVVRTGKANVMIEGVFNTFQTSDMFKSDGGAKKLLWIIEDMIWSTIHPTNETDLDKLEQMLIMPGDEEKRLIMEEYKQLEEK
jgi:hypothetical protein